MSGAYRVAFPGPTPPTPERLRGDQRKCPLCGATRKESKTKGSFWYGGQDLAAEYPEMTPGPRAPRAVFHRASVVTRMWRWLFGGKPACTRTGWHLHQSCANCEGEWVTDALLELP